MQQLFKTLWSLAIFILIVTAVVFSAGLLLVILGVMGLLGICRYYLKGRNTRNLKTKPYAPYPVREIVDVTAEVVNDKINDREFYR